MKAKLINRNSRLQNLLFILTLFFSITSFSQSNNCEAYAGTLTANDELVTIMDGTATISATPNGDMFVPDDFMVIYGLTQGEELLLLAGSHTPEFQVTEPGNYTIHTLVYNPDTANLGLINLGSTTGFDVNAYLIQGGGMICASLDVAGAAIAVMSCDASAGTLTADMDMVYLADGAAMLSATANGDANIPEGYEALYVLTEGEGLVIQNVAATPNFEVAAAGNYTIHTLVYNAETLDLSIVVPGTTTGFDVNGLLLQGGGMICASLDVAGAAIAVMSCDASAGTLTADMDMVYLADGAAMLSATANGDATIPQGYETLYVLTEGEGLVIQNVGATPSFEVTAAGNYTIHTLVYNAETLDLSIVVPGTTTGFDVNGLLLQGGGMICASLDVAGAAIAVMSCDASAGTLTADMDMVYLADGAAMLSATANGDATIPQGYEALYVLTEGEGLVIQNVAATPNFEVTAAGNYTIHTLVYNVETLDLSIVVPGTTTGFDVNGLLLQGGGMICASLDVAGAAISVMSCDASAGTLTADMDMVYLADGAAMLSATANGDANIPQGYEALYVLTAGEGLVIQNVAATPNFEVTAAGNYTIHTLVYNAETLDLSIVVPGTTTGFDVNGLLLQGGGMICASLDVAGAAIAVMSCDASAGTLTADMDMVYLADGAAMLTATVNGDANIPEGYEALYVLTEGEGLVIQNVAATPNFEVTAAGNYTIHTLVYNAETLDLSIVVPGTTTGFDVNGLLLQGGGMICASLDVAGAAIVVSAMDVCLASSGTMYSSSPISCLSSGQATINAMQNEAANIPEGYQQLFVLTEAFSLTIIGVSATPEFDVTNSGFYRIHSLVYRPDTLDLSVVVPGTTTGFDVLNIISDNNICASLDVHGAINLVISNRWFCYFFNYYHRTGVSDDKTVNNFVNTYNSFESFKKDFIENNTEIKMYPNPVRDNLNMDIVLFDNEVMHYTLLDMSGRQISNGTINTANDGKEKLNVSALQNGMYLMRLQSDYRTVVKKIQVNK
ncbi:T9SS type A sorting domain-containing protein [Lacinutrix gracilariae]|uniref:T9SS type A sorting domain-containing protein n=1 Tax=Lacinutrix gracilariae TaxID=1747198 RepID=A0ABW5K424_9FLAO